MLSLVDIDNFLVASSAGQGVYHSVMLLRQGWWAWGLSALGYPSAKGDGSHQHAHALPSGFTEADMQELRTALSLDSFDSQHGTDAKESARKMEVGADVKVCM